jgi:hypothetical protein
MTENLSDNEEQKRRDALSELSEIGQTIQDAMESIERDEEAWWNSLSSDQQISALCCVSRRIYKGDIQDNGTYRYVLYNVFGFGPESYARAQMAGYLAIHNSIVTANGERTMLERFCKINGIENAQEMIDNYVKDTYF